MPSKRGANWLPLEDRQLAASWLKITQDIFRSTGQKRQDFFKRVAEDFNEHAQGINREWNSVMHRWGHIQKATMKFSRIYHLLEKNHPSESDFTDLFLNTKKAFYEQEGNKFLYEHAWFFLKDSPKWKALAQTRGNLAQDLAISGLTIPSTPAAQTDSVPNTQPNLIALAQTHVNPAQDSAPSVLTIPSTPAAPTNSVPYTQPNSAIPSTSNSSSRELSRVHVIKRLLTQERFKAKRMKLLAERASAYRERREVMNQRSDILRQIAQAEMDQINMEIMSRREQDLPDEISRQFLRLQKKAILNDLKDQIKAKESARSQAALEEQRQAANKAIGANAGPAPNERQEMSSSSIPASKVNSYDDQHPSSLFDSHDEYEYDDDLDPALLPVLA